MNEIWKDIKGYEGYYQVSNLGMVKTLHRIAPNGRIMKEGLLRPRVNKLNYSDVDLYKSGHRCRMQIHTLVAIAFLGHNPCGYHIVVNHKDFNRLNNSINNLELVSQRENTNKKHIKSSSKHTGVSWSKDCNKWRAQIYHHGKAFSLGFFINESDAAMAYNRELLKINS